MRGPELSRTLDPELLTEASLWGIPVEVVAEITSTNDELLRRGEEGAPGGTLLFAESQTAGRGRFQRPWNSAPGLGLWFSLLLRWEINDRSIPLLSAFAAIALIRLLHRKGLMDSSIKEPNDVLIRGRKVAGILVETRVGANPFAVVGVGLNVNHSLDDFPEELRGTATSLAMVGGTRLDLNDMASGLIAELGRTTEVMTRSPEELMAAWARHLQPAQGNQVGR